MRIILASIVAMILALIQASTSEANHFSKPHLDRSKQRFESPQSFLIKQTNRALAAARSIPPKSQSEILLQTRPTKNAWLNTIYDKHVVDASEYSELLSDKRLMTEVFSRSLGESVANKYLPKTIGLREFLERNNLVDKHGNLVADGDQLDTVLHSEFPTGFFVRPAVGVAPTENEQGMFASQEDFINELVKRKTPIYDPATYWIPIKSHILNTVASGEAVVLQENLTVSAELKGKLKRRAPTLVRIHTYQNKVIPNSVPKRWVLDDADDHLAEQAVVGAAQFAQIFLDQLPEELTRKQAWSLEVAAFDNGTYRISNILTNRGQQIAWSTYLDQPRILKAYTQYFESQEDLQFDGIAGRLLRYGFANYFTYWKIRFEKAQGWRKIVAALPPWS